jgi:hypothetical protein
LHPDPLKTDGPKAPTGGLDRTESAPWPGVRPAAVRGARETGPRFGSIRKLAEATERATSGLPTPEVASMSPLDVMQYAMRLELQGGHWRSAASIAEKAALHVHSKMAPRTNGGDGDNEVTIKIVGGLPG